MSHESLDGVLNRFCLFWGDARKANAQANAPKVEAKPIRAIAACRLTEPCSCAVGRPQHLRQSRSALKGPSAAALS